MAVDIVGVSMIRDFFRFLFFNIAHYGLAIWGLRLRLDPDYPPVTRLFPHILYDSVFEYRTYGAMIAVSLMTVGIASYSEPLAWELVTFWALRSFFRVPFFRSNYLFWRQAYQESPRKNRTRVYYVEWCIREAERAFKNGERERALEIESEAWKVQDEICKQPTSVR